MTKDRLGEFLSILESIEACQSATNAALLLKEAWSPVTAREIYNEINRFFPTKRMRFDRGISDEEFCWQLKTTLAQSFSIFLEVLAPLPNMLLYELERLTQDHSIEVPDSEGRVTYLRVSQEVKVFSFVERDLIEAQSSYGCFYALFGTILSI